MEGGRGGGGGGDDDGGWWSRRRRRRIVALKVCWEWDSGGGGVNGTIGSGQQWLECK